MFCLNYCRLDSNPGPQVKNVTSLPTMLTTTIFCLKWIEQPTKGQILTVFFVCRLRSWWTRNSHTPSHSHSIRPLFNWRNSKSRRASTAYTIWLRKSNWKRHLSETFLIQHLHNNNNIPPTYLNTSLHFEITLKKLLFANDCNLNITPNCFLSFLC